METTTWSNGKITVSEKSITVKRFIGSITISRREIDNIQHGNGFANYVGGIINTVLIFNARTGIRQLASNPLVVITTNDGKKERFTCPKEDYKKFVEAL